MQTPFAIVPVEAAMDHRLTAIQLRVLIAILSFRNKNTNIAFPSRAKLAERCGYSEATISRATSALVELGWLRKVGKGGRGKAVEYEVTVPDIETVTDAETVADPETVSDPVTILAENGDRSDHRSAENGDRSGYTNRPSTKRTDHRKEEQTISLAPEPKSASGAARRGGGKREPITNAVWQAYRDAYIARYGVEPIRNARVNGMLAQFVRRLGADIAPQVAAYYLRCNHRWYVARGHSVDAMLRDAEKLYTEWASGRVITETEARNMDRMQGNYNAFARLLAECEEEIRKQGGNDEARGA